MLAPKFTSTPIRQMRYKVQHEPLELTGQIDNSIALQGSAK